MKEYILWATKIGDEDWQAQIITVTPATWAGEEKIRKARAWAEKQGFDRFRVSVNDSGIAPDFSKVLSK